MMGFPRTRGGRPVPANVRILLANVSAAQGFEPCEACLGLERLIQPIHQPVDMHGDRRSARLQARLGVSEGARPAELTGPPPL